MSLVGFHAQNHPQQGTKPDVDDRATTPELFAELNQRFNFTVDVAAAAHNAQCERYYTVHDDGLVQRWHGERVWCNPPYSSIAPWVRKAWDEWESHHWITVEDGTLFTGGRSFQYCAHCDREQWSNGVVRPAEKECPAAELIVMLLPANRTEQAWWQRLVEPRLRERRPDFRVEFLPGRIRFLRKGQSVIGPNERPPFGCCLLIWERS